MIETATKASSDLLPSEISLPALADEIRAASNSIDPSQNERRSRFINEKLKVMTPEELTRFDFFVRSHFSRKAVKSILQKEIDEDDPPSTKASDDMAIVVSGLAKLLVGELVETAREIRHERSGDREGGSSSSGKKGKRNIQVSHLEEAVRRLQDEGKLGRPSESSAFLFSSVSARTPTSVPGIHAWDDDDDEGEEEGGVEGHVREAGV